MGACEWGEARTGAAPGRALAAGSPCSPLLPWRAQRQVHLTPCPLGSPGGLPPILVFFKSPHGERPKELLGHREPGEQALKVGALAEARQPPPQLALRRARRPAGRGGGGARRWCEVGGGVGATQATSDRLSQAVKR